MILHFFHILTTHLLLYLDFTVKPIEAMISNPDNDSKIEALVAGTISHDDLMQLQAWTDGSPDAREEVRRKIRLLVASRARADQTPFGTDRALSRFYAHIAGKPQTISPMHTARPHSPLPRRARMAVAAAVALMVAMTWGAYHWGASSVKRDFAPIVMEALAGSQLNLTLPDGTQVKLNSGSRMSYSQGFGITDRKVKIDGEGHFIVHHDQDLPFQITTRELTVSDLGTEFSFRNYTEDEEACVELYSGKVCLENNVRTADRYDMNPGERMVMDKRTGKMTRTSLLTNVGEAREMSHLFFENMTIASISRQLSRSYGVKINVAKSVGSLRFYGGFDSKADSIDDVMKILSETGQLHYRKSGDVYTIY